jgi:hypothetical protein
MDNLLYTNTIISNSSNWEDYKILIEWTNSNTVITLNLIKTGIDYEVLSITESNNIHINLVEELSLGSKNY